MSERVSETADEKEREREVFYLIDRNDIHDFKLMNAPTSHLISILVNIYRLSHRPTSPLDLSKILPIRANDLANRGLKSKQDIKSYINASLTLSCPLIPE